MNCQCRSTWLDAVAAQSAVFNRHSYMEQMVSVVVFSAFLRTYWMATFPIRLASSVDCMNCTTMAPACCAGCTDVAREGI